MCPVKKKTVYPFTLRSAYSSKSFFGRKAQFSKNHCDNRKTILVLTMLDGRKTITLYL